MKFKTYKKYTEWLYSNNSVDADGMEKMLQGGYLKQVKKQMSDGNTWIAFSPLSEDDFNKSKIKKQNIISWLLKKLN